MQTSQVKTLPLLILSKSHSYTIKLSHFPFLFVFIWMDDCNRDTQQNNNNCSTSKLSVIHELAETGMLRIIIQQKKEKDWTTVTQGHNFKIDDLYVSRNGLETQLYC